MMYKLSNRRYIGNKTALLDAIFSLLNKEKVAYSRVADLFAGTGVVSEFFLELGSDVIVNDILYSNWVFYQAWLSDLPYREEVITDFLNLYNDSSFVLHDNYFSQTFSGTYFHYTNALRIGTIREHLEKHKKQLQKREFFILLSSLLYTADKIANTVGHFESYLTTPPVYKECILRPLAIKNISGHAFIYQQDANNLAKEITADLVYIDPPYNARQYVNFYHVLENLAEWKCPEVFGKTLKLERQSKMSEYSKSHALNFFTKLIHDLKTSAILVSYNNTYNAKSEASNNKISEEDLVKVLQSKGDIIKIEIPYKFFNAGKTSFKQHKEILYLCKVKN